MAYRHKVYNIGENYNDVLKDYPCLKQYSTNYDTGFILPKVESLNSFFGENTFVMGDLFTSEILNKWLDILEKKGILADDQRSLESNG
jgi:hypothetical protein